MKGFKLQNGINEKAKKSLNYENFRTGYFKKSNIGKFSSGNAWIGILILLVFVTSIGLALITEAMGTIIAAKRSGQIIIAQSICDAGIEKAVWKLNKSGGGYMGENGSNMIDMGTGDLEIIVNTLDNETKEVITIAYVPSFEHQKVVRKVRAKIEALFNETGVAFHYGIQVGGLGVTMSNNAKVLGNVYSGGPITGGNGSEITGDAIVSGPSGMIMGNGNGQKITIGNDAKAHTIGYANIGRDAYYKSISNSTVGRNSYPNSPDPTEIGLPLAQSTIDQWENWAASGSIHEGNYTLDGTNGTLGPVKINGDLTVINNATLNITGVIWVTGNVRFSNGSKIKLDPAYGAASGMIVADSPNDKINYGKVTVSNNVTIQGSGNTKSYIMIVSTNTGQTTANPAIVAGNNSDAVVYYSTTGMVEVSNNARLRAVTGGGLHLSNGAEVQYDAGLADSNFSGGPGGSWRLTEWQIIY